MGCGTDEFCLFRCDDVELSVQMGNGSVCCDVERISFVFLDSLETSVAMENKSVLSLRWRTVRSCLFRFYNAELFDDMINTSTTRNSLFK